nr:type II toxin-antitoxin system RelE/ParE family toxin [uncultured Psychroserpens sp.]
MAKRNVVWTKTADLQFIGILEYWVKHNKSNVYSKKLIQLVSKKTEHIAQNSSIHKFVNFKNHQVASLGHFSIYFRVNEDLIIITAFWDTRQDPKKLLKILQNKK